MRLIQPLVRREPHVAVDAENAALRVPDQRDLHILQGRPDRRDQLAEWGQHFGLVDRFTGLEPGGVVVVAELAEKSERCGPEPEKAAHPRPPPAPLRRAQSRNSRLPFGPRIGLSTIPTTAHPSCAATQPAARSHTSSWTAGSRTTPPLPTRSGPASNCGFTSATSSLRALASASGAGST